MVIAHRMTNAEIVTELCFVTINIITDSHDWPHMVIMYPVTCSRVIKIIVETPQIDSLTSRVMMHKFMYFSGGCYCLFL